MPLVSVIIPMYNVERYVGECIQSVLSQTVRDLEVIVVDDASPDGSRAVVQMLAERDERVRIVTNEVNGGLHRARRTGVAAARGSYALFLDADDLFTDETVVAQLLEVMMEEPVDVLRYGLEAVPVEGMRDEAAEGFMQWSNKPCEKASGREVARMVFDECSGYQIAWHVDHRLYRTNMLKHAFAAMSAERLERAEDAYEYFVVSYFARSEHTRCDIMGYRYRMGAGVTNARALTVERFLREVREVRKCYEAAEAFAASTGDGEYQRFAKGLKHKLLETSANDWHERVAPEDKLRASQGFVREVGAQEVAHELWRFVRDHAYGFIANGTLPQADDQLFSLVDIARSIEVADDDQSPEARRYRRMRTTAEGHLAHLERVMAFRASAEAQDIRIFVTTHKRVDVPDSSILQLVQVGPGNKNDRIATAFHDDEGDNLSERNPMYCEMTTQYWAWKNVSCDYVGFCHYRRYFNFSDTFYDENEYGEVMDDFIDADACQRYGLDDDTIRRCVEGYDVITTGFHELASFPGGFATPREHYVQAPYLHIADLERMADIVKRLYPDYADDVDGFLDGPISCFCNMYLMRKELFDAYAAWVFPVLEEFCATTDMSHYSKEALRTPGHLTERLFNIYYLHATRCEWGWKTKQLQCVHFQNPDVAYELLPVTQVRHGLDADKIVPVVFASDDAYVPMLTTTILSMVENASKDRFYDIVVFEKNISMRHRQAMLDLLADHPNVSLRFHNVWRLIKGYDLSTNNEHISMETYYRFLIQEVLGCYDKVLYLDSDLIIQGDVAQLFDTELGNNLLAAAIDIDFLGNLNNNDGQRLAYARDVLRLADPYAYFQAGVLVLNTAEMRRLHTVAEWMGIVSSVDYIYDDQDILNAECQGRVVRLPNEWNVMHDCGGRVANVFTFAPNDVFDAYQAARRAPKVIHYAGWEKPWVNPDCDYADVYWSYARRMPFYEMLLGRLAESTAKSVGGAAPQGLVMPLHEKAVSEDSPLRRIIDPIAPYGTARREVLKSIGRLLQGKK